jgi:hypothetical protein
MLIALQKEWARNGSFMKKPTTGWLHDEASLNSGDGVYYPAKVWFCAVCMCVCVCVSRISALLHAGAH